SGTPLWNLAEQQGMRSACYYWVGSESAIGNMRPTWYYKYSEKTPNAERVSQISAWLALPDSIRPHMITLYFSIVDHQGHEFGPETPETYAAVQEIDSLIGVLDRNITATGLSVNLIVVSDHGMERIDTQNPIDISKLDFGSTQVVKGGNMWMLYSKDSAEVERVYAEIKKKEDRFHVYRKSEVPAHLHFSQSERIGELVLISDAPAVFGGAGYTPSPGAHGFDATVTPSMGALFVAKGPQIKGKGKAIPPFENVHVYPYVAGILGLSLPAGIDGDSSVLKKYRKK
ncbi:MAG: alkaline phosphatase family protein, partial [Bacteroidetes bacterium]